MESDRSVSSSHPATRQRDERPAFHAEPFGSGFAASKFLRYASFALASRAVRPNEDEMVSLGTSFKLAVWLALAALVAIRPSARGQTDSLFVSGAWSGNVTATSATVCVRLTTPGLRVRLGVSTRDQLTPLVYSNAETTAAASGNIVSLDINGLLPNTDYFYGIEVAGELRAEPISRGRFRTFPQGAASFKLAFASCGDFRDSDQRAFEAILAEQPLLFVHTGDFHYSDTNSTSADDYRLNYDQVLNHPVQGAFYRSIPVAYMWDDHDFAGNNSNGNVVGTAAARATYREYVPHYPINVTGGTVGQAFTVGRVRIIMTDLRSAAGDPALPETASKTRLGVAQKAWFKQELIGARDAGFPLILWVCPDPWIDQPTLGSDTWGGHATERAEIANFIKSNAIRNVVILSGDMHSLAYDDGTNSDYATGGGAPLVVLHAAALTRDGNIKGGPYTAGPFPGSPQYGVLEVTDRGGATVQCVFSGKRVGEGAKLVFQFNASAAAINPVVMSTSAAGTDRAFVNLAARGRITSATDALIAGFVIGGRTSRTVLLRGVGPTLSAFGVADAIPRPEIALFRGATVVASNSDWTFNDATRLNTAFDRSGAFRLNNGSRDAALLLTLEPGSYTLQAKSLGGVAGSVLVEIFEVP